MSMTKLNQNLGNLIEVQKETITFVWVSNVTYTQYAPLSRLREFMFFKLRFVYTCYCDFISCSVLRLKNITFKMELSLSLHFFMN